MTVKNDEHLKPDHKSKHLSIGMSLWNDGKDFQYGALRQIQLANIFFPKWIVRVYIPNEFSIPENLINKMKSLGAEIIYIDMKTIKIPFNLISLLIVDEKEVDYFIIRDVRHRFSEGDVEITKHFMSTKKSVNLVKCNDNNARTMFFTGLLEGHAPKLRAKLIGRHTSMKQFIQVFNYGNNCGTK